MVKALKAARLADQIRDYLALWIHENVTEIHLSVTQVTLSSDLRAATVWVEINNPEKKLSLFRELQRKQGGYQKKLYQHLQRQIVPKLHFALDEGLEAREHLDMLLKG